MDLTGQSSLYIDHDLDEETNILTMTIKDELGVPIDTIVIENIKYKALMRTLYLIATERTNPLETWVDNKLTYNVQEDSVKVEFI
jgi:hypothetical protein